MKDLHGLKRQQILKACQALLKHVEKQKVGGKDLLEEDEVLYLVRLLGCGFPFDLLSLWNML